MAATARATFIISGFLFVASAGFVYTFVTNIAHNKHSDISVAGLSGIHEEMHMRMPSFDNNDMRQAILNTVVCNHHESGLTNEISYIPPSEDADLAGLEWAGLGVHGRDDYCIHHGSLLDRIHGAVHLIPGDDISARRLNKNEHDISLGYSHDPHHRMRMLLEDGLDRSTIDDLLSHPHDQRRLASSHIRGDAVRQEDKLSIRQQIERGDFSETSLARALGPAGGSPDNNPKKRRNVYSVHHVAVTHIGDELDVSNSAVNGTGNAWRNVVAAGGVCPGADCGKFGLIPPTPVARNDVGESGCELDAAGVPIWHEIGPEGHKSKTCHRNWKTKHMVSLDGGAPVERETLTTVTYYQRRPEMAEGRRLIISCIIAATSISLSTWASAATIFGGTLGGAAAIKDLAS